MLDFEAHERLADFFNTIRQERPLACSTNRTFRGSSERPLFSSVLEGSIRGVSSRSVRRRRSYQESHTNAGIRVASLFADGKLHYPDVRRYVDRRLTNALSNEWPPAWS